MGVDMNGCYTGLSVWLICTGVTRPAAVGELSCDLDVNAGPWDPGRCRINLRAIERLLGFF